VEEQMEERKTFNEILMESIDEILAAIGGSAKEMIYLCLKERGISKDQIPYRIDDFVETLRSILGAGVKHIELYLIKQIEAKTTISYPVPVQASSLQDCVVFIRHEYESLRR
jgi:hypothetical protein